MYTPLFKGTHATVSYATLKRIHYYPAGRVVLYTDGAEEKRRARHKAAIAIELASGGSGCYHHSPTPIN
jgi:hypothetical protein